MALRILLHPAAASASSTKRTCPSSAPILHPQPCATSVSSPASSSAENSLPCLELPCLELPCLSLPYCVYESSHLLPRRPTRLPLIRKRLLVYTLEIPVRTVTFCCCSCLLLCQVQLVSLALAHLRPELEIVFCSLANSISLVQFFW